MKKQNTPRSGFTLIELLTVIAIIGILAAILVPTIGKAQGFANKTSSAANARSIALSYSAYSNGGGRTKILVQDKLDSGSKTAAVAIFLAEKVDLIDGKLWVINGDLEASGGDSTIGQRNESNAFISNWDGSERVGYDFALGVGGKDPGTTTPLLWTRGLTSQGTWGVDTPWGRGGHIAFLDGHVQYYDELDEDEDGALINPTNGQSTTNINEVIKNSSGTKKIVTGI